ncbi:hypothetical protein [Micromonospora sp. CPCC 205561]|uniref:hypothetical protein n=1 Tax=Micromonospora sp. CPCC 205561 TaxID=3122407 RepID=UPI003FA57FD8
MKLKSGDVVHLTRAASPQFVNPIVIRVIRELPERFTYHGWLWFEGYQSTGRASPWRSASCSPCAKGCAGSTPRPPQREPSADRSPGRP